MPDSLGARLNLIEANAKSITPEMLPLVELDQDQIDNIVQTVPGGVRNVQDIYPLTPAQEGLLFHHRLNEQSDAYVLSTLLELQTRAHLEPLIAALQHVIERHDVLRSAVLWEQLPRPVQVVYRSAKLLVDEPDFQQTNDSVEKLKERMMPQRQKWNLKQAPLIRLSIASSPTDGRVYALLQFHHMIFDHGSLKTIVAETVSHLEHRSRALTRPLPYRDHVAQALKNAEASDAEEYFRGRLSAIDEPTAPFGLLDVQGDGTRIEEARQLLDFGLEQRVRTQARNLGITAARLFHAAWALVVSRTSGRDDVVFGTVLLARRRRSTSVQPMVGMFVNTLPLRLRLRDISAKELVQQTEQELGQLMNYEETPLAVAQRCSGIGGAAPLFSALLTYRHSISNSQAEWSRTAGIRVLLDNIFRTSYPVTLTVDNLGEGFSLIAQTDRCINPTRVIEYLQTAMLSLIEALEKAPDTPALSLSVLPNGEWQKVVNLFNAGRVRFPPEKLVHELFEEQVQRTPNATVVFHEGKSLTYVVLNERANQLARHLNARGVGPDRLVGLCVERSLEMLISMLGILKAGGAYLPLDPHCPAERLEYMLRETSPKMLLIQERLRRKLPNTEAEIIAVDANWDEILLNATTDLDSNSSNLCSKHLAYVIYTSGSTGAPKGVMVEHGGLLNYVNWALRAYALEAGEAVAVSTSLAFDATVTSIFCPLLSGRLLVLLTDGQELDGLERILRQPTQWSLIKISPAHLHTLGQRLQMEKLPCTVNSFVIGGEALSPSTVALWRSIWPQTRLFNEYGPTETVVGCTVYEVPQDWVMVSSVPIGYPIENTQVYILDKRRQPVPIGVTGEIYVAGAGVARGYLNQFELTALRFVENRFDTERQARMYRTGDLGRWTSDGVIEYLGRDDHQVKVRGYRIELGEIESHLTRHEHVKDAVVVAARDVRGEQRLVAYIVGEGDVARKSMTEGMPQQIIRMPVERLDSQHCEPYGARQTPAIPSSIEWNSRYTGQTIPGFHIQEWFTCTLERIRSLRPKKVLEIGCGTGFLLQELAPQCPVYVATDVSAALLEALKRTIEGEDSLRHVKLLHRSVLELKEIPDSSFDTIVLNFVVRCFPNIDCLVSVLQEARRLLVPAGKIFIGGIGHLGLLRTLHSGIEFAKSSDTVSVGQLKSRISRSLARERELMIDPQLFREIPGKVLGLSSAEVQLERGAFDNELTRYRYDVVLEADDSIGASAIGEPLEWGGAVRSMAEIEAAINERRWDVAYIKSLPNKRLARDEAVRKLIEVSDDREEVGMLRHKLSEMTFDAIDPEYLWKAAHAHGYDIRMDWSSQQVSCFEVQLIDRERKESTLRVAMRPLAVAKAWTAYANDPAANSFREHLIPQLREHLKGNLPEYMIPSAWVFVKQLPLTPNGKVDRRALPAPEERPDESGEYIAPRTSVECALVDIWAETLGVTQVGVQDNFFERGGHSLLATRMISRIHDLLGVDLPIRAVFEAPTVSQLSVCIGADKNAQEALWMKDQVRRIRRDIADMPDAEVLARIAELENKLGVMSDGVSARE